jgi:hypothetical protein
VTNLAITTPLDLLALDRLVGDEEAAIRQTVREFSDSPWRTSASPRQRSYLRRPASPAHSDASPKPDSALSSGILLALWLGRLKDSGTKLTAAQA